MEGRWKQGEPPTSRWGWWRADGGRENQPTSYNDLLVGLCWPLLAVIGFCGPSLTCIGFRWPSFIGGPSLAWPVIGYCGPSLTCVGLHWPSLAAVGLR